MNLSKLQGLFNFISLVSKNTDAKPMGQSPDYIMEKFKRYIGGIEGFEFPELECDDDDYKFLNEYFKIWNKNPDNFSNILVFINKANWDSETLPSVKLKYFKKYIGDYSSIIDSGYHDIGIHPVLNDFLVKLTNHEKLREDLEKLNREFGIDLILNGK